jgi:hypothetical protein
MGIQVSLPAGGDPTLGLSYFIADTMALRADFGLAITSASGASQGVSVEVALRDYITQFEHFMPFIQPGVWVGNPGSAFTFAIEGGLGGEYFVTDHFSFGALTGVAFQVQAPSGASAIVKFTTGTSAVFGQFLW